jgi:hypothetical protein
MDTRHYGDKQCPGRVLATTGPGRMKKFQKKKAGFILAMSLLTIC